MDHAIFSKQVKLAYDFMDALHQQALALIKDVEGQVSDRGVRCMRPGGYKFNFNSVSASLEQPKPVLTDFYSVCFIRSSSTATTTSTSFNDEIPPIAFLRVTLRERNLHQPEVRYGVITKLEKPDKRKDSWPTKVEDLLSTFATYAFSGDSWSKKSYKDGYVEMTYQGDSVPFADLPDSEAIAGKIVDPLLKLLNSA
jgi:hypothetical protein